MSIPVPPLPFDLSQPYGLDKRAKQALLLDTLNTLTQWHQQQCMPYRNILAAIFMKLPPLTGQFDLLESGRWTQ